MLYFRGSDLVVIPERWWFSKLMNNKSLTISIHVFRRNRLCRHNWFSLESHAFQLYWRALSERLSYIMCSNPPGSRTGEKDRGLSRRPCLTSAGFFLLLNSKSTSKQLQQFPRMKVTCSTRYIVGRFICPSLRTRAVAKPSTPRSWYRGEMWSARHAKILQLHAGNETQRWHSRDNCSGT